MRFNGRKVKDRAREHSVIRTRRKCQWRCVGDDVQDHRCRGCALEYDQDMDAFRCLNCGGVRQVCFAKMLERYQQFGNLRSTITASNVGAQIADAADKYLAESWHSAMGIPNVPEPRTSGVLDGTALRKAAQIVDALRCFVVVHADDAGRQPVKDLVAAGYELQLSAYMPVGFGFFQSPEKCGHIDFANGTAMVWENTALKFDVKLPYWNTSATDRLADEIALKMRQCPPIPWTYREPV